MQCYLIHLLKVRTEMFKKYLIVFLISMVPIVELRGAVPFGTGMSLPWYWVLIIAMVGNMLPVPFIFLFGRGILEWGSRFENKFGAFFRWCLDKGHRGGKKLTEKAGQSTYIALLLFVGIPLPGTGAWTGTLAASLLDLDFKKSSVSVMCGVLLAGVIMTIVSLLTKAGISAF